MKAENNKHTFRALVLLACLLLVTLASTTITYLFFPSRLDLPLSELHLYPFTDQGSYIDKGNSEVTDLTVRNQNICYKYILKEKATNPCAGVGIDRPYGGFWNISDYTYIRMKIKAAVLPLFRIYLRFFLDDYTRKDNYMTYCYLEKQILFRNQELKIKIDDFKIPIWWYEQNGLTEKDLRRPFYNKLTSIEIQNSLLLPRNTEDQVEIAGIAFEKEASPLLLGLMVLSGGALGFIVYRLIRLKYSAQPGPAIPELIMTHKQIEVTNHRDEELHRVVAFLEENFTDPELSLEKVNDATGISVNKIPVILNREFRLSFKQYLNLLRINRAKELLSTTDWQVTEVAFHVGYNSLTHFGRVFKQLEGISPYECKKKMQTTERPSPATPASNT